MKTSQGLSWISLHLLAPLIEKGLLLPASPIIAYQLEGSPIRQTFYTPLAFAPLIKRGILRPAPDSKFPIIAYHQNGKPIRQGVEEDGHIWWDICEC